MTQPTESARIDARCVFDAADRLRPVYVRSPLTGRLSWWLVDERSVVLVAPQIWPGSQQEAVKRHVQTAIATLTTSPIWGEYG